MLPSKMLTYHNFIKSKKSEGQEFIWCSIRKKYLVKTPEEWVRQLCIQWLIRDMQVPAGLISIERKSAASGRFDLLVYTRDSKPLILIECKSPDVPITDQTAFQWARYNTVIRAPFGLLTNALSSYSFQLTDNKSYQQINKLPLFPEMIS